MTEEQSIRSIIAGWYFLTTDQVDEVVKQALQFNKDNRLLTVRLYKYLQHHIQQYSLLLDEDEMVILVLGAIAAYVQHPNPPFYLDDWFRDNDILETIS